MDSITTAEPRIDGRNARSRRTRAIVIEACRVLMLAGDFRPTTVAVAKAAGCSVRSVFQHFTDIEGVHRAAMDMPTRAAISTLALKGNPPNLCGDCIAYAAVFGRPLPKEAANG